MKEFSAGRRSRFGAFIVDSRGTVLGFDRAIEELTGWPAIEVVGRNKNLSLSVVNGKSPTPSIRTVSLYEGTIPMGEESGNRELTLNRRDGGRLDVEAMVRPLNGPGDRMLVTVLRVLARRSARKRAKKTRGCDELTGLPDREAFVSRLTAEFKSATSSARPLSLILVDVDRLREVNDRLGRPAGDEVLRKMAGILRVSVEDENRIARLGDDDFAVLLANGGRGEARQVAAALRSTVERFRFFRSDARDRPDVTISLGAASFPADADTERELMERAQDALGEARKMGRNRVWCYLRRPRVPLQVPVYFDSAESLLVGYTRDLSPSGIFVQTTAGIEVGMRCALAFPLPGLGGKVHVVGRVVRSVYPDTAGDLPETRIPGLGVEFERFGGSDDRRAIDKFLHGRESTSLRPETGILSVP